MTRKTRAFAGVGIAAAIILAACTQGREALQARDEAATGSAAADMALSVPMAAPAPPPPPTAVRAQRGFVREASAEAPESFRLGPPMLIRTASVRIQVDSLELAIVRVRQIAASLGGHISNSTSETGEHQVRSATLVMRIPSPHFDSAFVRLPSLGKVEGSGSHSQDVGEEFVDVTARMANAKRLEDRLVTLLATRTGKLEEVLTVERELARVRQEIERYEGRVKYLSAQVAMSSIDVNVHEKAPIIAVRPGPNVIGQAFAGMWRNFVRFVAAGIEASGVLIPVALLAWVGWLVWRRFLRQLVTG